jgi:4-diphosphocytidyl-2-C-methyl-D-erythritol kinase
MTEPRHFKATSPAKLNLTFEVLGSLPNGFHQVETLLQAVDLADELTFTIQPSSRYSIKLAAAEDTPAIDLPTDSSNLVAKAVELYLSKVSSTRAGTGGEGAPMQSSSERISVAVEIRKIIPIAAGLGGGSSNGAAALLVLNRYFSSLFPKSGLEELAAELGSDVPFFIHGSSQIGRNRGEELAVVPTIERMFFVVVKPKEISVATPWIYEQYDRYKSEGKVFEEVRLKEALSARQEGNVLLAARTFKNVFEPILFDHYPVLHDLKRMLVDLGASGCGMTGSGPTLFAICDSHRLAMSIAKTLNQTTLTLADKGRALSKQITLQAWPAVTIDRGSTVIETSPHLVRAKR